MYLAAKVKILFNKTKVLSSFIYGNNIAVVHQH